jgi:hypothetical protein
MLRYTLPLALTAAIAAGAVHAESRISSVAAATSTVNTSARLNFAVNVPRILYLRVGDAGTTVNTVTFNVSLAPTSNTNYAGGVPSSIGGTTVTDDSAGGGPAGGIAVQLWTNNGTSTLNCTGAALTSGANTIPLSAITATATGGLSHPGTSLACAGTPVGSAGTNALSGNWAFAYAPATLPPAGAYTTVVTYTASQP